MNKEVRDTAVNTINERLELLETELLLVRAAERDDTFDQEHVRAWASRLRDELRELRDWNDHLKETP